MRGKFVVIEGTDGSGKGTQLKLLKKHFRERKIPVITDDYPHYRQFWGGMVGRMLMGDFGKPAEISPYLSCLPYMIDEFVGSRNYEKWLKKGKYILSNRYFTSQTHQVGKLKGAKKKKFREWVWGAGWNQLKILKPDLIIVLLVPPKIGMKLVLGKKARDYTRGKRVDKVEHDYKHQLSSYKEYLYMCRTEKNWVRVNCCTKNDNLKTPNEIHAEVVKLLQTKKIV